MANGLFSLSGRRALVTGASRGIGKALALGLARAGADVAVSSRDPQSLKAVTNAISSLGRKAKAIELDVMEVSSCGAAVTETMAALGGIDILINNAGIEQVSPSLVVTEELWDKIVDTNLKGAFFMAQAAAREMKQGTIVNIASLTSERGIPTAAPYGSSKAGLVGMTRALAVEWASRGIRVNAIEPGYFRTALTEQFYRNEDWQRAMQSKIPLGRFGELDDLVGACVFLCADASRYVTGICLPVDGGTLASI